ncbi:MAG: hypothetical protein J6C31_05305 [Prevotella sp.]|nr:hypothetical protein [Prevotella sp.]
MAIAFLATIAAQMGAAWFNSSRNKAHSKKMAELQRAYEEKATQEGIENARREFAELCAFQREIENQSQLDRLTLIRNNHEQILLQDAYENALHKWPLLVPPYVIANAPLTIGATETTIIPLNCILTTSSDLNFNKNVFHKIDEQIAVFCSRYWNVSANKSIRFFQEAWRDDAKDIGSRHKDIYAHLKNVPTLLISPILKNDTLLFRFYWWGLSIDPTDAHINDLNELNPELSISLDKYTKYTSDVVETIVSECTPKLEAFISFFADLYYWNFYKVSPSLPTLLNSVIALPSRELEEYKNHYTQQLIDSTNDDESYIDDPDKVAELIFSVSPIVDTQEINNCIVKYINTKKSSGQLNSYFLNALSTIKDFKIVSVDTQNEIQSAISSILKDEEIGYFPCIGRNELFQTILNQKIYIPSAVSAVINPLNQYCSIIHFLNQESEIAVGPIGYRTYIATHPEFSIKNLTELSLSSLKKFRVSDKMVHLNSESVVSEDDIQTLLIAQRRFVYELERSFERLKDEFWNESLSLVEISYETIPTIINQISNNSNVSVDTCLIIVGYSKQLDNYTLCMVLLKENQYVGDRFVCRSNSLDKTIRQKLNYKTILKIQIK